MGAATRSTRAPFFDALLRRARRRAAIATVTASEAAEAERARPLGSGRGRIVDLPEPRDLDRTSREEPRLGAVWRRRARRSPERAGAPALGRPGVAHDPRGRRERLVLVVRRRPPDRVRSGVRRRVPREAARAPTPRRACAVPRRARRAHPEEPGRGQTQPSGPLHVDDRRAGRRLLRVAHRGARRVRSTARCTPRSASRATCYFGTDGPFAFRAARSVRAGAARRRRRSPSGPRLRRQWSCSRTRAAPPRI